MKHLFTLTAACLTLGAQAQLVVQSGATFFIDAGATVTVQGDVTSNADITGTGKLEMKGTSLQTLNTNGFKIPNLKIDNTNHVALGGATVVTGLLEFTNGKIQLGNHNFTLGTAGTFSGAGTGKFAETNGTGLFAKQMNAAGNTVLPVGNGTNYTPLQYNLAGGTYGPTAFVAARSISGGHPNKHPRSTDFINNYWALGNGDITGATISATGTYLEGAGLTGVEADIRSMVWNGTAWTRSGATGDIGANTVTAPVTTATNDLYAMNTFLLATPKIYLQAAIDLNTNRMRDLLRNSTGAYSVGVLGANNILPSSDPYRSAPLTTGFTHTNNSVGETLTSINVLNDLASADNNIVDWVFLELRNTATSGNTVLQTRAALLQRDGDIVDIDGTSPVYFKNLESGNYNIGVRHRNHVGMYTNPSTYAQAFGLANTSVDFTSMSAANLTGASNVNYLEDGGRKILYAGNASMNTRTSYSGSGNDASFILSNILSSNPNGNLNPLYSVGDVNMNRRVSYSGSGNDASYILSTPLGGSPNAFKAEIRPN